MDFSDTIDRRESIFHNFSEIDPFLIFFFSHVFTLKNDFPITDEYLVPTYLFGLTVVAIFLGLVVGTKNFFERISIRLHYCPFELYVIIKTDDRTFLVLFSPSKRL